VQCLDDSTDKATRDVVDAGIEYWTAQVRVRVRVRG